MGNKCGSKPPPDATHTVYVKTGDKKGASTDGNIFVSLGDEKGKWSEEQLIDTKWKNDFEAGNTDVFHLKLPGLEKITELCLRRDGTSASDDWYVEKVVVVTISNDAQGVFPVTRWVHANEKISLSEFDSTLPQQDKYSEQRVKELEAKRKLYELTTNIPGGPMQIAKVPADEQFSNDYKWDLRAITAKLIVSAKYIDLTTSRFKSLDDFKKIYKVGLLPLPYGAENWKSDEEFGNQRLSGCNPVVLKQCQAIPKHFAVTAAMVEPFLEDKSLDDCIALESLYIMDLTYLADIECTDGRKLPGPTCLLYVRESGDLVPIAIQLMPKPAEDNPVFLPSDPEYTWIAAKMWFNMADAAQHQAATHVGSTHILMELVAVVSHRQLSPSHPINRLLAPHFLFLIAINTKGVNDLIAPGSWIDSGMQMGGLGMTNIIAANYAIWDLMVDGNLPADLKNRGVDNKEALPNYHYRDDAILLWNAINKYVSTVVNGVYDSPDKLSGDLEIQNWAKEIAGANMKGMPSSLSTNDQLIDVLTSFIFTCSVRHAAANFNQYDEYGFPPNYPGMLYGERPKDKTPLTEDYVVESLITKSETVKSLVTIKVLSEMGTNELTNFEVKYGYDPISQGALKQLQSDLKEISTTIDERNTKRVRKYPYLHPKVVPNSISI